MKVIIRDTKKDGSIWAAHHIAAAIKAAGQDVRCRRGFIQERRNLQYG